MIVKITLKTIFSSSKQQFRISFRRQNYNLLEMEKQKLRKWNWCNDVCNWAFPGICIASMKVNGSWSVNWKNKTVKLKWTCSKETGSVNVIWMLFHVFVNQLDKMRSTTEADSVSTIQRFLKFRYLPSKLFTNGQLFLG